MVCCVVTSSVELWEGPLGVRDTQCPCVGKVGVWAFGQGFGC
jgi:hypothetical protein